MVESSRSSSGGVGGGWESVRIRHGAPGGAHLVQGLPLDPQGITAATRIARGSGAESRSTGLGRV